ncbi:hypothetical protein FB567DRAFT_511308 [Paraphoma chrysanthemicola]|uniref:Mid2 domain-containing protein n=1 Tax=Paraphoma chrysanthemicola TaxID=798071 RepID=A0A8K0W3R9_9PLEO|nr:hypothetical protein FB567DRAFT_511308 [Paraphoma chrysanthemicola]
MLIILITINLLSILPFSLAANICYLPDGSTNKDVPCDPNAPVTQCCGTRDACLSNGLCILSASNNTGISYARGTCTDRSWSSPLCPQQCQLNLDTPTNQSAYDFRSGGVQVWQCGSQGYARDAAYCCESEAEKTRCCSTSSAVFTLLAATIGASTSVSTSSSTPITSTSRSSSTGPTASASRTESGAATTSSTAPLAGESKSNSKAIGIGVGVGGAVLIIIAAGIVFFIRKKKRQRTAADKIHANELPDSAIARRNKHPVEVWTQPQELPTQTSPAAVWELPAETQRGSNVGRRGG